MDIPMLHNGIPKGTHQVRFFYLVGERNEFPLATLLNSSQLRLCSRKILDKRH